MAVRPQGGDEASTGFRRRDARVSDVMIGRDDLVALTERRLAECADGDGQVLLVAGEAGIGKSRLLAGIVDQARDLGFVVVRASAFPRDSQVAGAVVADLAAELAASPDPAVAALGSRAARLLRSAPAARATTGADGSARHRRTLVAELADIVAGLGTGQSAVLLALEDLHWADDLSLEVLERAARRGLSSLLVVGTYRTDELGPTVPLRQWRARLVNQRLGEELRLGRLTREQTAALVAGIADIAGGVVPSDLVDLIHRRSDGIPLHVEELMATSSSTQDVPESLATAVLARAALLSPGARSLAGTAAVIGRSFDLDLLLAVTTDQSDASGQVAGQVDAGQVDDALAELVEHSFVRPVADGSTLDFRHALIRDALAADVPPLARRALHGRVAAAAADAGLPDAFVSDHYERASRAELAHRYARSAAARAIELSAHREAVALLRRAQRTTPSATSAPARADLLVELGTELAAVDDNEAAREALVEAYALRLRSGDDLGAAALLPDLVAVEHLLGAGLDARTTRLRDGLRLLADAGDGPGATEVRSRLLAALAAAYMLDRRLDEAIEVGQQAQALAADRASPQVQAGIGATLGSVLLFAGQMTEGWELLRAAVSDARDAHLEAEAARAYRMIGTSSSVLVEYATATEWLLEGIAYAEQTERWNDRHYMTAHLAHVRCATGDWAEAERLALLSLVDGRGGITTRITALHVLGYLALGRGEHESAATRLEEALSLGRDMNELQRFSPALWGLAENARRTGRALDAQELCEQGFAASDAVGDAAYLFPFVVTGTRAYLDAPDLAGARGWFARCEPALLRRGIPGTLPAIDHARGLVELAEGRTGVARELLKRAGGGWGARDRFWEATQCLLDLARCAARSRRPGDARTSAALALAAAEEAGATVLVADAGRLLSGDLGNGTDPTYPLTPREFEVALLGAQGLTNQQIARRLTISPKTVSAHVEHMLAKLGAVNRAEIAVWAARVSGRA